MNTNRPVSILILAVSLMWIFVSADKTGVSTAGLVPAPQKGFPAPDFTLRTLDGETVQLSNFRGNPILINLWATWCPPCRAEMPAIEKIYNEYKDEGLIILGMNMTYQDQPANIKPFIEEYSLTFPILLEETGIVADSYQLKSLPSTYFVGRDGIINDVVIGGPMAEALLRTRVEAILK